MLKFRPNEYSTFRLMGHFSSECFALSFMALFFILSLYVFYSHFPGLLCVCMCLVSVCLSSFLLPLHLVCYEKKGGHEKHVDDKAWKVHRNQQIKELLLLLLGWLLLLFNLTGSELIPLFEDDLHITPTWHAQYLIMMMIMKKKLVGWWWWSNEGNGEKGGDESVIRNEWSSCECQSMFLFTQFMFSSLAQYCHLLDSISFHPRVMRRVEGEEVDSLSSAIHLVSV